MIAKRKLWLGYTVYMLTSPNGKKYIGCCCGSPERRWSKGEGYRKNKELYADIQKYGWDSFEKRLLVERAGKADFAYRREAFFIKKFKTLWPNGYNRQTGGQHGWTFCEDTKRILTEHAMSSQTDNITID